MEKNNWSDEQLKSLLRQFPTIKDERDPKSIYRNIAAGNSQKRIRRPWLMPAVASVFALMLLIVIGESFFRSNNSNYNLSNTFSSENSKYIAINEDREDTGNSSQFQMKEQTGEVQNKQEDMELKTAAVYSEDMGDKELLTYPIPDKNIQVAVPVSILVDNPESLSKFDLYKKYMASINETSWGLDNYYPFDGTVSYDMNNKTVIIDFADDVTSLGAIGSDNFLNSIVNQQLESVGAEKMEFRRNGQKGVLVGDRDLTEMSYRPLENRGYYLLSNSVEDDNALYVPWETPYFDIETALADMQKDRPEYGLSASIPDNIRFDKVVQNKDQNELVLFLTNDSSLGADKPTLRAIESILLTAKDFRFRTVKFENAGIDQIGRFEFANEIPVPVAANKREID